MEHDACVDGLTLASALPRFQRGRNMLLSNRRFRILRFSCVATVLFVAHLAFARPLPAEQVKLQVGVASPTMLAGEKQTNFVRISLEGFEIPQTDLRPPVNVAIVIDNSGSMSGSKIQQARQAAMAAVNRLRDDDIVSVVLYNSSVQVLVPATKASDRRHINRLIKTVKASGNTALFAGVSKGAAEVRKFRDEESVNRVILLSDGRANVGPSSPRDLERLGGSLVKEGISVSTLGLGLGYNEDLMSGLASTSSGNHIFVEEEEDLVAVFNNEFSDLMSVVAGDFKIHVRIGEGIRAVRVLGTKADIIGQDIYIPLAQLYAGQQRYFVLEVEVDASKADTSRQLVSVDVEYQNMIGETTDKLSNRASVRFSDSVAQITEDRDHETNAYCAVQIANERNVRATALRDAGQIEEAKSLLNLNVRELFKCASECKENNVDHVIPELEVNIKVNKTQVELVEAKDWNRTRKSMRAQQTGTKMQQTKTSLLESLIGGGKRSSK